MTENEAFNHLVDLLASKGRLKIITSEPDPDRSPLTTPINPAYFIQHDVVKVEKSREGILKAHSEEGDWCEARPKALLSRLTEHNRGHSYVGVSDTRSQD